MSDKTRRIGALTALTLTLLPVISVNGQQLSRSLEEIVVTAERPLSEVGIITTRIDSAALRSNISLSMADVIGFNSSVFVKSSGRATLSTLAFRGTAPSHTAVTWNGLPINSPALGMTDFSLIPAYFVDRASLLYGSSSLRRSSGGLGGMVDMTTTPADIHDGLSMQYIQGVGSFTTFDEFLRLGWGSEYWKASTRAVVSTSRNNFPFTNHDRKENIYDDNYNIVSQYHPRQHNTNGGYADFHILQQVYFCPSSRQRFGLDMWFTSTHRDIPLTTVEYIGNRRIDRFSREHTLRSVLSYLGTFRRVRADFRLGWIDSWTAYDYSTDPGGGLLTTLTRSRTSVTTVNAQGIVEWLARDNFKLSADIVARHDHVATSDRAALAGVSAYNNHRYTQSLTLNAHWQASDRFALSALMRGELIDGHASPIVPALFTDFIIVRDLNLRARASASRTYHAPTLNDLYFLPGGNPDLRSERGTSLDASLAIDALNLSKSVAISGALGWYDSMIDDWILWLPTNKGFFSARNLRRVHAYGLETSATVGLRLHGDWFVDLGGSLGYTYSINRSEALSEHDRSVGKQLPYVPRLSASAHASARWRQWQLSVKTCFYSKRYTMTSNESSISGSLPHYFVTNIEAERRFAWHPADLSVKIAVNNIFNADYQTVMSHPMPGINFELFFSFTPHFSL